MQPTSADQAAQILWTLWSDGRTTAALPDGCKPLTIDDGWQIQRRIDLRAGAHAGWKIAATSGAGQRHIGADGPLAGRLYERCIVESGAELDAGSLRMRTAEAEFAFRLGQDLTPTHARSPTQLASAIEHMIPAIEVPDTRFDDFLAVGLPSLVADAMCVAHVVIGQPAQTWAVEELAAQAVTMRRNDRHVAAGSGAAVLGGPLASLAWLVGELEARGERLRAGDLVITGASTPPNPIAPGDRLGADFGELGTVSVCFAAGS